MEPVTEAFYNWTRKLISGIICHDTLELNHGQPGIYKPDTGLDYWNGRIVDWHF